MVVDDGRNRRNRKRTETDDRLQRRRQKIKGRFVPQELVFKILLLLPARYVFNLRSVCKSWLSLITDPAFVSSHIDPTLRSPPTTPLFVGLCAAQSRRALHFYNYRSGATKELLLHEDIPSTPSRFRFIRSSGNGLLLLYSENTIHVFNPVTRDIVKLPFPPSILDSGSLGFGVDPCTGKYKVVLLLVDKSLLCGECHVFSQGSLSWRKAASVAPKVQLWSGFDCPVSVKGFLYWTTNEIYPQQPHGSMMSCDLNRGSDDKFTLFPMPTLSYWSNRRRVTLEILQERLCIVDCLQNNTLDIWMLQKRGEYEWSKQYSITLRPPRTVVRVPVIHEGNALLVMKNNKLCLYDLVSRRISKLVTESTREEKNKNFPAVCHGQGCVYTESLAPVC